MNSSTATYRIQFCPSFGFRSASSLVPCLSELGISDLYASPIFEAATGILSGYNVQDKDAPQRFARYGRPILTTQDCTSVVAYKAHPSGPQVQSIS